MTIIPEKIEKTIYVIARQYEWEDKPTIIVQDCLIESPDHVLLHKWTKDIIIPLITDDEYISHRIHSLNDHKTKILAAAQVEVNSIEESIQKLQALPFLEES